MKNTIKNILFFCLTCLITNNLAAQNAIISYKTVQLIMPDRMEGLETKSVNRLEEKITAFLLQNGIVSNGFNNIVLYPTLHILDDRKVNTGIDDVYMISAEFNIFMKQADNSYTFASLSKKITGSGRTKNLATNNLINAIKLTTDSDYKQFLEDGNKKYIAFYDNSCEKLMEQITTLQNLNQFDKALTLSLSIPHETTCYKISKELTATNFKKFQSFNCQRLLNEAKALIASNKLNDGFMTLALIDPTSSCAKEVPQLFSKYEGEKDLETQRNWELLHTIYTNAAEIEKYRLRITDEILLNYLMRGQRNAYRYQDYTK